MPYILPSDRVKYNTRIEILANIICGCYREEMKKNSAFEHFSRYSSHATGIADLIRHEYYRSESTAGQLNYVITKLILETYKDSLPNYKDINNIIGTIEAIKQDMYLTFRGISSERLYFSDYKLEALAFIVQTILYRVHDMGPSSHIILGVLECVKQEFYRRIASPYEDEKIEENGDIK